MRATRQWLRGAAAALVAAAVFVLPATAMAAPQNPQAMSPAGDLGSLAVFPVVDCVIANKNGGFTALFGYYNWDTVSYTIKKGVDNNITPANLDGPEPQTFKAGVQSGVFAIFVPKGTTTATWSINGWPAQATMSPWFQTCDPSVSLPATGNGYGFVIVLLVAGAFGAFMIHRSPGRAD